MSRWNPTALIALACVLVASARTGSPISSYSNDADRHSGCNEPDCVAPAVNEPDPPMGPGVPSTGHKNLVGLDRSTPRVPFATSHTHIPFIANEGQQHKEVRFYAQTFGGTVFVTHTGRIVYSLPAAGTAPLEGGVAFSEQVIGGKPCHVAGLAPAASTISYFRGGDPADWRARIATYDLVDLGEIYDGIRLQLEAHSNNVEKRVIIESGAEPTDVRLQFDGVEGLTISATGQLEVYTRSGLVTFTQPVAYQEDGRGMRDIAVAYWTDGNEYGFRVGDYDPAIPLIIDPMLASTFLGGSDYEAASRGVALALDAYGNVYVAGRTTSLDFPETMGAYDEDYNGGGDIFVSKFDADLTTLLASTFLGGSSDDFARCTPNLAIDGDGNVYVAAQTTSPNFPSTTGAYDETYNGGTDAFVSKLTGDLGTLLASTYLGGSDFEVANSLAVSLTGNVYVAGYTTSDNFPVPANAYQPIYRGNGGHGWGGDIFITELSGDLSVRIAATYLGGSGWEDNGIIAHADNGDVFVVGTTNSTDFPTTTGAYSESYNGGVSYGGDAFVSRLTGDLTALVASTYLGGNSNDWGFALVLDADGDVYVTGNTPSTDFPTTPGAYAEEYIGVGGYEVGNDAFVTKLSGDLTTVLAGTFLGGTGWDHGGSLKLNAAGDVFVAGVMNSADFPTTPGCYSARYAGGAFTWGGESFVTRLDDNLTALLASTLLGGAGSDYVSALSLDADGNVYVAGATNSSDYPTTPGAYDPSYNGGSTDEYGGDVFVSKLDRLLSGDCNGNGLPDSCDLDCQAANGECTVPGCGGSEDNDGNGQPDECCVLENMPLSETPLVPKNRYLSFTVDGADDVQAVQVMFVALPGYTYANGRKAWVQEPVAVTESPGSADSQPPPTHLSASLGCEPYYTNWSALGTVDVYDAGIVPGASYEIRAIAQGCDTVNAALYSSASPVGTSVTGDVVGSSLTPPPPSPPQGVVDFNDISGLVDKFKNVAGAPRKARADIINSITAQALPDHKIDFVDISYCVDAFRNREAPLPGPPVIDPCE